MRYGILHDRKEGICLGGNRLESQPETEPAGDIRVQAVDRLGGSEIVETSQTARFSRFLPDRQQRKPGWIEYSRRLRGRNGSYIKALKTGIIQADGWGGVDLAPGNGRWCGSASIPETDHPQDPALDLYLRGKERVSIEEIRSLEIVLPLTRPRGRSANRKIPATPAAITTNTDGSSKRTGRRQRYGKK
jgi:hypothetical protein